MQATTTRPPVTATADGAGVVSHAGSRLLADVADRTTLTEQLPLDAGPGGAAHRWTSHQPDDQRVNHDDAEIARPARRPAGRKHAARRQYLPPRHDREHGDRDQQANGDLYGRVHGR